jgi:hypothetical protein
MFTYTHTITMCQKQFPTYFSILCRWRAEWTLTVFWKQSSDILKRKNLLLSWDEMELKFTIGFLYVIQEIGCCCQQRTQYHRSETSELRHWSERGCSWSWNHSPEMERWTGWCTCSTNFAQQMALPTSMSCRLSSFLQVRNRILKQGFYFNIGCYDLTVGTFLI